MSRKTRERKDRSLLRTNQKRSHNDRCACLLTYLNKKIHQYLVYLLMSSAMSGSIS